MSPMLIFCQSSCAGLRLEIGLHVVEQLVDVDLVGGELDLLAVAEAELDRRPFAGRLGHDRLEAAPVADDLVEPLLPALRLSVGSAGILLQQPPPVLGRLGILPAVLEDLGQLLQRLVAVARLRLVGDLLDRS